MIIWFIYFEKISKIKHHYGLTTLTETEIGSLFIQQQTSESI